MVCAAGHITPKAKSIGKKLSPHTSCYRPTRNMETYESWIVACSCLKQLKNGIERARKTTAWLSHITPREHSNQTVHDVLLASQLSVFKRMTIL